LTHQTPREVEVPGAPGLIRGTRVMVEDP